MGKIFGNWIVKNILWLLLVTLAVFVVITISLRVITRHGQEITVPDFTGMTISQARARASKARITVEVTDSVYVRRMLRGTVYRQNPKAGGYVKQGRRVMLTINAISPKKVTMPNLVGYSMRQAKAELMSRGLQLGRLVYVNDIATNNVLGQLYNGSTISPGTTIESESSVDLIVGLNRYDNHTFVPNIIGTPYLGAVDAVQENSLNVGSLHFDSTVRNYTDSLAAVVYRQVPQQSDYSIRMGSSVDIYLTTDSSKVPVQEEASL